MWEAQSPLWNFAGVSISWKAFMRETQAHLRLFKTFQNKAGTISALAFKNVRNAVSCGILVVSPPAGRPSCVKHKPTSNYPKSFIIRLEEFPPWLKKKGGKHTGMSFRVGEHGGTLRSAHGDELRMLLTNIPMNSIKLVPPLRYRKQ